jgi:chromosome condensin MukBEF ATPase and DNA-binding subunit MukB
MTAALLVLRRIASAVPWWVWVLAAMLAWGCWQRHQAKSAAEKYARAVATATAERESQLAADAAETARRLQAQQGATNHAKTQAQNNAADAARARAAADQLRAQLATLKANGGSANTAPAAGGPPAGQTVDVLSDLLGRCVGRARELAEYADAARTAGETCEASYDALTTKPYRAP